MESNLTWLIFFKWVGTQPPPIDWNLQTLWEFSGTHDFKPRGSNKNLGDPTKTSGIQQRVKALYAWFDVEKTQFSNFGKVLKTFKAGRILELQENKNLKNRLIFIFVSQEFAHKLDVRKPRSLEANDGFFLMLRDQTMGKDGPSARECSLAKSKLPYSWSCLV